MNESKSVAQSKGRGGFNIVDIIILIVVLLVIAAASFLLFYNKLNTYEEEKIDVQYQLRIEFMRSELTDHIKTGDKLYNWTGEYEFGEVLSVDVQPAVTDSFNQTSGQMTQVVHPDRYNIYVTLKASAVIKNEAYYIDNQRFVVGSVINVRFPDFQGVGACLSISEAE